MKKNVFYLKIGCPTSYPKSSSPLLMVEVFGLDGSRAESFPFNAFGSIFNRSSVMASSQVSKDCISIIKGFQPGQKRLRRFSKDCISQ